MAKDYDWDTDIDDNELDDWDYKPKAKKEAPVKSEPVREEIKPKKSSIRLVDIKCPNCGAELKMNPKLKTARCGYCGSGFNIQEEIEKVSVSINNPQELGKDFEKGRIQAKRTSRELILDTFENRKQPWYIPVIVAVVGFLFCFIYAPIGIIILFVALLIYLSKPTPIKITFSNERYVIKRKSSNQVDIPLVKISSITTDKKDNVHIQLADGSYTLNNIEGAERLKNEFYKFMED